LGRGSDEAIAFVEADGTTKASTGGWSDFAIEAARARRPANDRRANPTAVDRADFRGRTNSKEAEIRWRAPSRR
jgi:hypothetical protein